MDAIASFQHCCRLVTMDAKMDWGHSCKISVFSSAPWQASPKTQHFSLSTQDGSPKVPHQPMPELHQSAQEVQFQASNNNKKVHLLGLSWRSTMLFGTPVKVSLKLG
jgi:hypothetical protein